LAENGFIHLINSGAACLDATGQQQHDGKPVMKPFWEIDEQEIKNCLNVTDWYPGMEEYFRGGGYSSGFLTRGDMPFTMSRLNLVKGLGPVLQIAEGWTVDLPADVHETLNERTNPTWPTHYFVPRLTGSGPFRDVYSVMANWGANHGALSFGHIGADLVSLAAILRIPVAMHNLTEESLFRPSAWGMFGAMDPQGADFRACANFGPLYGQFR
jgi:L-fucose isomerase